MPAANPSITVVRERLAKADEDLRCAAHLLTLGSDCPTNAVGFHAQQCAEKCIKGLLVFRATPFPRTHDLAVLRALLPPRVRPKMDRNVQERLTRCATVKRYPGAGTDLSMAEARQAMVVARSVRREVRKHLPRAALRREKKG